MRQNGHTYQVIADEINRLETEAAMEKGEPVPKRRAVSTIQREYYRNRTKTGRYNPVSANEMAMERRERIVTNSTLRPGVLKRAIRLLKEKRWSPNRVSIHDRPKEADGKRFGDWEMDLVIGKGQKSQVLTLFERSQSFFLQTRLPSKKPTDVTAAVIRLLRPYKRNVLTVTTDNGIEFMEHEKICKALDCTVYFADPYCSGQKGSVENINKIFREYFPKGTDFRDVKQHEMDKVQYQINERPRKKLGFSTPKKEFFKRIS